MLMMPVAHYRRPGWARALLRNRRWAPLATAMVVASCTSDQPTEPAAPVIPPVALTVIGCPGCFLLDHFSDADGTFLESHVPDGEGIPFAWMKTTGPTAFRDTAVIRNDALGKERQGFWRYLTSPEVIDTTVVADTAEIELEVLRVVPTATQYDVGLIFRDPSPGAVGGFGGYTVFWSINGDGFGFFEVDRGDDNGSLLLFQDHPAIPTVGTHTLGASVSKTGVIRIYVDGSLEASVTDPSPLPAGDLGLTFGFTGDTGAMRITSFVGRRRSPPRVRIEPVSGSLEVRPVGLALSGGSGPTELQLRVRVDAGGRDLNGQEVNLTLTAVDSSGQGSDGPYGHIHAGVGGLDKPPGKLVPQASVNTGADGLQGLVRYTSSDVSGPIVIRAEIEGALPDSLTIPVGVPGLSSLGGRNSYVLVGDKPWHPRNHWGLPIMVSKLEVLADGFSAKFGRPIYYNDMSLPFGGVFDVDQNWSSQPNGHVEHRAGRDLDLRTDGTQANGGMTPDQRLWAWNRWESLGGTVWNERLKKDRITPNTKNPHYHFRYRGPA